MKRKSIYIRVTETAHFYKQGERYTCRHDKRWNCFVVYRNELTLIDERHAVIIKKRKSKKK